MSPTTLSLVAPSVSESTPLFSILNQERFPHEDDMIFVGHQHRNKAHKAIVESWKASLESFFLL